MMAKSKDVQYIITLDGCRVAKAPTYAQAENLRRMLSKDYPSDMIFKVESREKSKTAQSITA